MIKAYGQSILVQGIIRNIKLKKKVSISIVPPFISRQWKKIQLKSDVFTAYIDEGKPHSLHYWYKMKVDWS